MAGKNISQLKRAKYPEEAGVSSFEIVEFFKDLKENNLEFHSFMVIKDGVVASELYRAPFNAETPHSVYSISKTVTAIAVGFAISEGLFSLKTKITDVFPEAVPENADERLFSVTVENLLTMTAGIQPPFIKKSGNRDWVKDFFTSPWYDQVGVFRYVNENIYILSAIVCKLSGVSLREYLNSRLFTPLNIEFPFWETDKNGIEAGGWGAYFKLEDIAKIMYCLSNGGRFYGNQIIPEFWVNEMCEVHADTSVCNALDSDKGYGYCMWKNGGNNEDGFRANGMFSQFGMVLTKENAVVLCFGAIAEEQEARDCIWRHFPKAFKEQERFSKKQVSPEYWSISEKYALDNPTVSARSVTEAVLNNRTIKLKNKILLNLIGFPVSVLPVSVTFLNSDRAGNINDIQFDFHEKNCEMTWCEGNEKNTIPLGMDGHLCYGKMTLGNVDYVVCSYCEWKNDDVLKVNIRPITTIAKRKLDFTFKSNDRVIVKPSSTPLLSSMANSLSMSAAAIIPCEFIIETMKKVSKYAPNLFEPKLKGKLVKRDDD